MDSTNREASDGGSGEERKETNIRNEIKNIAQLYAVNSLFLIETMKLIRLLVAGILLLRFQATAQTYDTNNVIVSTFAGSGFTGYLDGDGAQTMFSSPVAIVSDTASNLYVWDGGNARIRRITATGTVSTFVGGGGQYEGYGTNVSLANYGFGSMAIDHSNKIWLVVNYFATYLVSIGPDSYVSIENAGLPNLTLGSGICFDSANNLYYTGGNRIYRYSPNTGISQVIVGSGNSGQQDGTGVFSSFATLGKLAADAADNIYAIDGSLLRKIDQGQNVTTITNLSIGNPMFVDSFGNIIFASSSGGGSQNFVSRLTPTTNVIVYAGATGFSPGSYTNGPGNLARFNSMGTVCFSQGSIFVADSGNQRIRQISFNPQPQVVSGANLGINTYPGITINGVVGRTYQIQSSSNMTNWITRASVLLNSSPYLWFDQNPVSGNKFYRAVLLP